MSVVQRRERERAARQAGILQAAREVFAEKGFSGTTIDDIAERAELGKGTIYLYFKAKDEIYLALTEVGLAMLAERFARAIDPTLAADENMLRISAAYYDFYREEPQYFRLLAFGPHLDARIQASIDPPRRYELACMMMVESVIQRGIDEGLFSPSVNALEAAAIAWASSTGLTLALDQAPAYAKTLNLAMDKLLRMQMQIFISGLSGLQEQH